MFYDPNLKPKSNYEWEVEKSRQSLLKNGGREGMSVNMYDPSVNLRESLGFGQDEGIYDDDGYGGGERFSEGATLRKSVQEHGLGVMNDPKYCNPHEDITLEYNSHEGMWHCIGPGIPHEIVVGVTKDKALGALEKWLAQAQEKHVAKKAERKSEGFMDSLKKDAHDGKYGLVGLYATDNLNRKTFKKSAEYGGKMQGRMTGALLGGAAGAVLGTAAGIPNGHDLNSPLRGATGLILGATAGGITGGVVGKYLGTIGADVSIEAYDVVSAIYRGLKAALGGKEPTEDQLHAAVEKKGVNLRKRKSESMNDYSESALYLQYLREASEKDEEEEDEEELDEEGHEHHGKKKDKKEEGVGTLFAGKLAVRNIPRAVHVAAKKAGMSTAKKVAMGAAGAGAAGAAAYGAKKLYDKKKSESDYSEAFSSQGLNSKKTGSSEVADLHRKDIDFDRLVKNSVTRHDRKNSADNIQSLLGMVAATLTAYGAKKLYDWFKSNPDADKEEVREKAKEIRQEEGGKGKKESFSGYSEAFSSQGFNSKRTGSSEVADLHRKDIDFDRLVKNNAIRHGRKDDANNIQSLLGIVAATLTAYGAKKLYDWFKSNPDADKEEVHKKAKKIKQEESRKGKKESFSGYSEAELYLRAIREAAEKDEDEELDEEEEEHHGKKKDKKEEAGVGTALAVVAKKAPTALVHVAKAAKPGMSLGKKVAIGAGVAAGAYGAKKAYDHVTKKPGQESSPDEMTYSESLVVEGNLIGSLCDKDPFSDFRNFARNQAMAQLAESESKKHKDHEDEEDEEFEEEEEDGIGKKKKLEEAGVGAAAKAAAGAVKKAVGSQVKKATATGVGGAIKNVAKTGMNHAKIISHDIGSGIARAATKHPRSVGAGAVGGATALGGVTGVAGRMSKRKED